MSRPRPEFDLDSTLSFISRTLVKQVSLHCEHAAWWGKYILTWRKERQCIGRLLEIAPFVDLDHCSRLKGPYAKFLCVGEIAAHKMESLYKRGRLNSFRQPATQ